MSEGSTEKITKSDSNFAPTFVDHHLLPEMNFNGHCLIKSNLNTDFTLGSCLFGSVKLTKNSDLDKYNYPGYGITFDSRSKFLFTDGSYGKNVVIFRADVSSSVHVYNKKKDILILVERPTQRLDDTTLTTKAKYPINFTQSGKRLV